MSNGVVSQFYPVTVFALAISPLPKICNGSQTSLRKDSLVPLSLAPMLTILKAKLPDLGKRFNMVVAYDNFDFHENVQHQVSGKTGIMRSVTTGKVFVGNDIPDGGLLQKMLRKNAPLDYMDVMVSDGTRRDKAHN
jgi:hypothetical protein